MSDETLKVGDRMLFSFDLLRECVIREYLEQSYPDDKRRRVYVEVAKIQRHSDFVEVWLQEAKEPAP